MPMMSSGQDGSDLNPVDPADVLVEGSRVAVSGEVHVNGRHYTRGGELEDLFLDLELEYKARVSKTRCDALVVDPAAPVSGQLRSALEFGTPVITHRDFAEWAAEKLAQRFPQENPAQELAAPDTGPTPITDAPSVTPDTPHEEPEEPASAPADAEPVEVTSHPPAAVLLPTPGEEAAVAPRPESLELIEASARLRRDLRRGAVALAVVLTVFFLIRQIRGQVRES